VVLTMKAMSTIEAKHVVWGEKIKREWFSTSGREMEKTFPKTARRSQKEPLCRK